jgi:hypothetical protein
MKKSSVIRKENSFKCGCHGKKDCKMCNGTGIYKESHYYFIDHEKGIAIDSDNLA